MFKISWYNRPKKFPNGITWFRVSPSGLGLWWKDTRIAGPNSFSDAPGKKVRIGPYLIKVLK